MMRDMGDLVKFVAARLDEDEAAAKAATGRLSGRWYADVEGNVQDENTGGGGSAYVGVGPWNGPMDEAHRAHITRHDPAQVLREVTAKRAVMELWEDPELVRNPYLRDDLAENFHDGRDPDEIQEQAETAELIDSIVRTLAAVWSDHPDYQPEWKP
jgi:hypothetical protein